MSYSSVERQRFAVWQRSSAVIEKAIANPFVSYGAIAALQLRVIWNIWKYADLTSGDSSEYFVGAASWAHGLHDNVVYYPGYDAFWGTILWVVHSVYAATIIQRVAIVMAATMLVLAVARSLLGPSVGLIIAAWWAVIPENYHVLYEVRLLGAVPILLAILIVARAPSRKGLGIAMAIMLASAVLIRTELITTAVLLALVAIAYEIREFRFHRRPPLSSYLRSYGVPLTIACLLIAGTYARSTIQGETAWNYMVAKEEANFCNNYTFDFEQRHPAAFTGSPWSDCSPLMQQTFGKPMPTLLQAVAANPGAVATYGAWNARLLPLGLQVGLFGATSSGENPGDSETTEHSTYALVLSVLMLIVLLGALGIAIRRREISWGRVPARTRWVLVALGSVAVATVIVVLTSRPWAEYMYGLTVCAMILFGVSVASLLRRVRGTQVLAPVALITVLTLIVVLPSVYHAGPRPIYEETSNLHAEGRQLQRPGSVLVGEEPGRAVCNYLASSYERRCAPEFWSALRSRVSGQTTVGDVLRSVHATALYADGSMLAEPAMAQFVADPHAQGWDEVARGSGASGPWHVLVPLEQQTG